MSATGFSFLAVSSLSSSSFATTTVRASGPLCSFRCSYLSRPNSASNALKPSRLRIHHKKGIDPIHVYRVPIVSCLCCNHSEAPSVSEPASITDGSTAEATVDLKLPRRSLLVQFTCNACGVRTQKLINRVAYERGTVFVQCAGCFQHHRLIDNLGLVVEYDLREASGTDSNAEQV